jgi:hypothetical protein
VLSEPDSYQFIKIEEFDDPISRLSVPINKKKKQIVLDARVHPGESNASFMM